MSGCSPSKGEQHPKMYIAPVEQEDIPDLSSIFFASFTSDFDQRIFPHTPIGRAWWDATNLDSFLNDPTVRFMKVVDSSAHESKGKIIAYAKWVVPTPKTAAGDAEDKTDHRWPVWPADSDAALCDIFFGHMARQRESLMGDRPHYCKILMICC